MSNRKLFLALFAASLLGAIIAVGGFQLVAPQQEAATPQNDAIQQHTKLTNYLSQTDASVPEGLNFVMAAEATTPCVVHIKSTITESSNYGGQRSEQMEEWLRQFGFEPRRQQPRSGQASGSGVIISKDGYIVTNNHVIDKASDVKVVLNNNKSYEAKVIGTDPATDLAVIKIDGDGDDFPFVKFGDSDGIKVGQWVLAVGNPFELNSTVTAGIISAKGRNININRSQYGIESFIQTDAAVNPGNSGGALVNLKGELIGINTAIASPTGSYAGYSFAVPASLVKKVAMDLKEFGIVQRALLGVAIREVNADLAKEKDLDEVQGVFVAGVNENSSADDAGLEEGDVILKIDDSPTNTVAGLQESIARHRPGDKVKVTFKRGSKRKTTTVTLKNMMGETTAVKYAGSTKIEGATFANLTPKDKEALEVKGGAKIMELKAGKFKDAGLREGFTITQIDKRPIHNTEDLSRVLSSKKGGILIEGKYEEGDPVYYALGW
ncbi:Do family serine endopeptidase [Persicobacter psychrovividus]|uniref:Serine protease n=1 Tax=Persicobacter psychrovividus TaxID=387638 RepID=A0ABM7VG97_9BACT|nr:serine protease [Persicobacter psychrovividus]